MGSRRTYYEYEFVRYRCECGEITVLKGVVGVKRSPFTRCVVCGKNMYQETKQQKHELEKMMFQA